MTTNLLSVIEQQHKALKLAVTQNSHDMLMTGEELRKCEAALAAGKQALDQPQGEDDPIEMLRKSCKIGRELIDITLGRRPQATEPQALGQTPDVEYYGLEPWERDKQSPTAGMNIAQRILHVGGRNNEAGYVEFGSIQAVEALVRQVLRDLPPHPQATEPAPKRPPNCGTGHCSCIECVMEPAPSTAGERSGSEKTWCQYVAGMIGTYLNEPFESDRVKAIAGIIERRLWALPVPKAAVEWADWNARGMLTKLKCWHRLTEAESNELVALLSAPALQADAMKLADDFAAAAVNHYSAGENDKALWQKMADARQALETKLMEVK